MLAPSDFTLVLYLLRFRFVQVSDCEKPLPATAMLLIGSPARAGSDVLICSVRQMRIQPDVDRVKENLEQRGLVTIRLKELMTRLNSKWRYMVEVSIGRRPFKSRWRYAH